MTYDVSETEFARSFSGVAYHFNVILSAGGPLLLKVRSLDRQRHYYLGASWKCKSWAPSPIFRVMVYNITKSPSHSCA